MESKIDGLTRKVDSLKGTPSPSPSPLPRPLPPPYTPAPPLPRPPPPPASSGSWKNTILDIHNTFRCMHGTPYLAWDEELARSATKYAAGGVFRLASKRQLYFRGQILGENMGKGTSADLIVRGWYKWKGSSTYSQMLWASTKRVGCGQGPNAILVCRYSERGNIAGQYSTRVRANDPARTESLCSTDAKNRRPGPLSTMPMQYCERQWSR